MIIIIENIDDTRHKNKTFPYFLVIHLLSLILIIYVSMIDPTNVERKNLVLCPHSHFYILTFGIFLSFIVRSIATDGITVFGRPVTNFFSDILSESVN
jgi:hypothetical protein